MPKKKKRKKVVAQVVVPPDAAEVEVAVVLPAPPAEPPNLSWQTKGSLGSSSVSSTSC